MAKRGPKTKAGKHRKVARVMHEYKARSLRSSSGKKVTSRKQAIAIALRSAGMPKRKRKR